jgi:hypothetical protein
MQMLLLLLLQVLEANAAAPEEQRLSEAELIVDLPRLQQLRGQVGAEVAALLASSSSETQAQEIRAARIKAMCRDAMQVRRGLVLKIGQAVLQTNACVYKCQLFCPCMYIVADTEKGSCSCAFWDVIWCAVLLLLQTKPALCTGLKSGAVEVSNFPLQAQDEAKWAKVGNSLVF